MNVRASVNELDRIRRDIGVALKGEHEATEPAPPSLMALLSKLEALVRDIEGERLFARVDSRIAELICAAGREPQAPRDP
jgi:hypothetical protein